MIKKHYKLKDLKVKRDNGVIMSVTNPNSKTNKTVTLVQRGDFIGWTPVNKKTGRKIPGMKRGRTERTAIINALKSGRYKKVEIWD